MPVLEKALLMKIFHSSNETFNSDYPFLSLWGQPIFAGHTPLFDCFHHRTTGPGRWIPTGWCHPGDSGVCPHQSCTDLSPGRSVLTVTCSGGRLQWRLEVSLCCCQLQPLTGFCSRTFIVFLLKGQCFISIVNSARFPHHRFLLAPSCHSCACTHTQTCHRPVTALSVESWLSSSKAAAAFPGARPARCCCISRSERRGWHRRGDSCGVHAPCPTQPISGDLNTCLWRNRWRKGASPPPSVPFAGGQGAAPAQPWHILLLCLPAAASRSSS